MTFGIFMFLMVLLIPVSMIGFGWLFMRKVPENINTLFGYRTSRSMKNEETWIFAHRYIGKLWFYGGIIILLSSAALILFCLDKADDTIGTFGGIIVALQMIPMISTIMMTEKVLKKNFDESGRQQ